MCGIAGFLNMGQQGFNLDERLLGRMQQQLVHRGPDDHEVWKSDIHGLGLAFSRLKIIDLSDAGRQPMMDRDQSVIVVFNGEIYNYQELRRELENAGHSFFSNSDTETIINGYKEWGIDVLYKLDGMFAFALYDLRKQELFLVRDRIGVKPLYFSLQGGILSFASEIKALWELPWMNKELCSLAMYHYLTFMVAPAPYTIYKQVYKLPAGFFARVDVHRNIYYNEWYSPITAITAGQRKEFSDESFCLDRIQQLLVNATQKRMVSDVPFGAFLSGGIDSSLNVAFMSQFVDRVKTFTVAFEGDENNELKWARIIAQRFGTEHHEVVISEKEAFDFYEKMVYHLDEPLADSVCIPFYYVSKLAKESGVTVAQVGEGADELFFGYPVYAQYKKVYDLFWKPTQSFVPQFLRRILGSVGRPFIPNLARRELLTNWASQRPLFWGGAIGFNEEQKRAIVKDAASLRFKYEHDDVVAKIYPHLRQTYDAFSIVDHHLARLYALDPEADFCKSMFYLELKQRLPELLLMRADKMSMAASVEAREPFLDYKLVEFMYHVPASLKFKNNTLKYLLKKIAQGILPDVIVNRPKVGFAAPTMQWFTNGNFFPAYFKQLSTQKKQDLFLPAVLNLGKAYKNSEASSAVQQWILQNLWAVR
jgi:asparagine synthase (glutamine-hydrolysing)